MSKFYPNLTPELMQFIEEQKIFFTATAPTEGRINLSPKGIDTFRCLDEQTVGYLDLTGSGNETSAHLEENGRMTIMFCSFSDKPLILRLYGNGRVIRPRDEAWDNFSGYFSSFHGQRQIILLTLNSVQTSCGFGVPIYEYQETRELLMEWAEKKGKNGIYDYWAKKNQQSIDGLPTKLLS
ncbi:pyridoxamine 5'-phosphate oxidase family protein [Crocosphaera sp. UHCC 0190]|uniref:pyridoxamine 5'-phosphate oxidase family protein n=1 Tax=Crocosphaera sp. UHCC 0190 TaxID=3110246 RepID=UPI002B208E82|nr:pyridoxamine 5'-phosphate oxidase family protein [Crocosphaera sp. UHCC 0190]MEA5511556.1 pyridoxamine 5'-phosphate oxidase family protein [Crocosphaera sp. UHCC 0190]